VTALPQHIGSSPTKQVMHSSEYKGRAQLTGKKVMVCGTGETGMDLAYESIKAGAKEVYLCSRGGCVPRFFLSPAGRTAS
jgi:dimethylaniline monooxygenase (N-oxide forming)